MKKRFKQAAALVVGGLLLSLIISNVAMAGSTSRQSNIKSHGVFVGRDESSDQEVVLDTTDLKYLAGEIDRLEDLVDALSMKQAANIVYTYHSHVGEETAYGGCHTEGYHVHSGCGTKKVSHHCNGSVSHIPGTDRYKCNKCSFGGTGDIPSYASNHTYSTTEYTCGSSPINRWKLGCGYKDGEIEKAEIVFSPAGD